MNDDGAAVMRAIRGAVEEAAAADDGPVRMNRRARRAYLATIRKGRPEHEAQEAARLTLRPR